MNYSTVYELSEDNIDIYWFIIPSLIVLLIIYVLINFKKLVSSYNRKEIVFLTIVSMILLFFYIMNSPFIKVDYFENNQIFNNKEFTIIEGEVENFEPMPYNGHGHESFVLKGIKFEYSNNNLLYHGFSKTSVKGGPLYKNGQYLRISYITSSSGENIILKLELK